MAGPAYALTIRIGVSIPIERHDRTSACRSVREWRPAATLICLAEH